MEFAVAQAAEMWYQMVCFLSERVSLMLHRKFLLTGAVAVVIGLGAGCEWSGTSSEESWNDAYSWANFSGTYHLYNVIDSSEIDIDDQVETTQNLGLTSATDTYNGTLAHRPILAGSVTINIGGTTFTDQGDNTLAGGQGGTINYGTGAWSARTDGDPLLGSAMTATYTYLLSGTEVIPGSSITLFTVNQQGNLLTFTDNSGVAYSGRVTGANVPSDSRVAGSVRLNFEVKSSTAKLVGTLSGDWSGGTTGTLSNRSLLGTYSAQGGVDVDIQGASGSISITPLPVTTN